MSELDKILYDLAGARLISIISEDDKFYLKFRSHSKTEVLTFSAQQVGNENSRAILTHKSVEIVADE